MVEQHVLRFQITMGNAQLMEVVDGVHQLQQELAGLELVQLLVRDDMLEEFASRCVFHHQVDVLVGLDYLI